jgi:hypothetical protein
MGRASEGAAQGPNAMSALRVVLVLLSIVAGVTVAVSLMRSRKVA